MHGGGRTIGRTGLEAQFGRPRPVLSVVGPPEILAGGRRAVLALMRTHVQSAPEAVEPEQERSGRKQRRQGVQKPGDHDGGSNPSCFGRGERAAGSELRRGGRRWRYAVVGCDFEYYTFLA